MVRAIYLLAAFHFFNFAVSPLFSWGGEGADFDKDPTPKDQKQGSNPDQTPTTKPVPTLGGETPPTPPPDLPPRAPTPPKPAVVTEAAPAKQAAHEAIKQGNLPEAERLVSAAARRFPGDTELRAARDYIKLHQHAVRAEAMLTLLGNDGGSLFGRQWGLSREGDRYWDVSLSPERGTKSFSASAGRAARRELGKAYALLDQGDAVKAERTVTGALKRQGGSAELYYARAQARGMAKDFEGADKDSLNAIALGGTNAAVCSQRATLMITMGKREEAFAWAKRALELDPENPDALAVRGRVLWKDRRQPEAALKDLEQAALIDPRNYQELYSQALQMYIRQRTLDNFNMGDYRQAFKDAQLSLARDPDDPSAHTALGRVWLKMGKAGDAIKETTLALKSDPASEDALFYRAVAMETLGARPKALADLARAMEVCRDKTRAAKYRTIYERVRQAQKEGRGPIWPQEAPVQLAAVH